MLILTLCHINILKKDFVKCKFYNHFDFIDIFNGT